MKNASTHISFLDHIRGIAILAVFIFHCFGSAYGFDHTVWGSWCPDFSPNGAIPAFLSTSFGWAGVSIFFVVSGFCIHLSHLRSSGDWGDFLIRRFFRIYPPYLLALLMFYFYPLRPHTWDSLVDGLGLHILLLHNFSESAFFAINASFWSIAIEFQLYLLYPLVLLMVRKLGWTKTLLIVGLIEVSMRLYAGWSTTFLGELAPRWFTGSPIFFWCSWTIGAAAADAFLNGSRLPLSRFPVLLFPFLATGSALFKPLSYFPFLFIAFSTVSVIAMLLDREKPSAQKQPNILLRLLCGLGIVSYSLYLLHQPVLGVISRAIRDFTPEGIVFTVCLGLLIPIAFGSWLFYRLVELPSIDIGKRIIKWRRSLAGKRAGV